VTPAATYLQTQGTVRRMLEQDGLQLVSFHEHSGYFKIGSAAHLHAFAAAEKKEAAVTFTHDRDLNIIDIL
jgi:hypothetical protein